MRKEWNYIELIILKDIITQNNDNSPFLALLKQVLMYNLNSKAKQVAEREIILLYPSICAL